MDRQSTDSERFRPAGDAAFRRTLALVYLSCALLFGTLLALEWRWIDNSLHAVARERGAALFSLIETSREWNARHGGVYVAITDAVQPNPYLRHPARDLETVDGRRLTMINPAYMTRQIAELAAAGEGIRLHITSLDPIRSENQPDPWEAEALGRFARGEREVLELIDAGAEPVHRYMAPLYVTQPCLQCHAEQGYVVGDVRGGISVTMPASALVLARASQRQRTALLHLAAFVVAAGLIHGLMTLSRRHVLAVRRINAEQERLIDRRTEQLAALNRELADEADKQRRSAHQLVASEARYRAIFERTAEAIMVVDASERILQVNPAFCEITGYAVEDVMGRGPSIMSSGRHAGVFFEHMRACLDRDGAWQGEIWNRRKSGDLYVQWMSITRIGTADAPEAYVCTFSDITQRKEAEERIRYRADHDALTDLPNRALFADRLGSALASASRHGHRFALLAVDLDYFKAVNDRLGHLAGDALLVETAARLQVCVRESDTVARLGGDEFAVILTEIAGQADAEEVAERICASISQPFRLAEGEACVSASVGIAFGPNGNASLEVLQRRADRALYAAKAGGRGHYRIYDAARDGAVFGAA
jgi:diguanylate cyclase (GGDEF)-like protein/PAS domain S-box-containing protein